MRRPIIVICTIAIVCGLSAWADQASVKAETDALKKRNIEAMANSRLESPGSGIPTYWRDCLERIQSEVGTSPKRFRCKSWTAQGVTTDMIALSLGSDPIPVLESRLADAEEAGRLVVDIVGGPGGAPFFSQPGMTEEFIDDLRSKMPEATIGLKMKENPVYPLLKRGFTIASIGYWGTNIRTLNAPNEFELAIADVESVINFYLTELGKDPPLITTSLGNHLALGALGKDRLEQMHVLALVPVMDGLQHHLARHENEIAAERQEAEENDKPFGNWQFMNVYSRSGEEVVFDHSRFMPMHEYIPNFIGSADFPWRAVKPQGVCSKIVLGSKDPRTEEYLASNDNLPSSVTVLDSDHDIFRDALDQSRDIIAEYAACLVTNNN